MNLFNIEREKYWSFPSSYSKEKRKIMTEDFINSGNYFCSEKIDGNWCCFVKQNGKISLQGHWDMVDRRLETCYCQDMDVR